jgi:hypothetical protein
MAVTIPGPLPRLLILLDGPALSLPRITEEMPTLNMNPIRNITGKLLHFLRRVHHERRTHEGTTVTEEPARNKNVEN